MRSLLAVCLSAITMMGAAEAAIIDAVISGPNEVKVGESNLYTLNFTLPTLDPKYTYETYDIWGDPGFFGFAGVLTFGDGTSSKITVPAYAGPYSFEFYKSFTEASEIDFNSTVNFRLKSDYWLVTSTFCSNTTGCGGMNSGPWFTHTISGSKSVSIFKTSELPVAAAQPQPAAVVPLIGALPLMLTGLALLGWMGRRRVALAA